MRFAPVIGRFVVIACAAHVAAATAGIAMIATSTARQWAAHGLPDRGSTLAANVLEGWGWAAGVVCGPFGAAIALPALWRTELRKSVPVTAAMTVAAGAASGVLPIEASWSALFLAAGLTFVVGALGMVLSNVRWPLERASRDASGSPSGTSHA